MDRQREIDAELVRRLIRRQFPQWAGKTVSPIDSAGVDNAMFRLGEDLVVRLPRQAWSIEPLRKEQIWLPRLAPRLPTPVPQLMGAGEPCDEFDRPWSVSTWIEGSAVGEGGAVDWRRLATDLGTFLAELRRIEAADGPAPGAHNFWRGAGLGMRDRQTRDAIALLGDDIDGQAALAAWDSDSAASPWSGPACWVHGDLHGQNLLQRDGRLSAVIDFGGLGVGDPACDVAVAWRLLPSHAREAFRATLQVDEDTWRRARAWALSISLRELSSYRGAAPALEAIASRTLSEVLRDRAPN